MPVGVDGLDDAAADVVGAAATHGSKEELKVELAVLALLELVVDAVLKGLKALGTSVTSNLKF